MEKVLLRIQELEREAQALIDRESGSESIPSLLQRQKQQQQQQKQQQQQQPNGKAPVQQQQRRLSSPISTAREYNVITLEDDSQTPKVLRRLPSFFKPYTLEVDEMAGQSAEVVKKYEPCEFESSTSQEQHERGDGDWLREMKEEAGRWNGNKLVVLSLFDGIGGVWAALTRLGIPFLGYSSEVSAPAVEVVKARFPEVKHLGDVRKLARSDIREDVDLLVGGFPCQDLSCMGKREGLHGQRSRLFFNLLEALNIFQPKWFLVENVASMTWIDRLEISKYTGVRPLELDSIELTPTRRRRLYWTNIPHPPLLPRVRDLPSTVVQSCLQNATALEEKTGVILSTNSTENNYNQLEMVMENGTNRLRYLSPHELELLMGFPAHHTSVLVHEGANSMTSLISDNTTKKKNSKAAAKKGTQIGDDGETQGQKEPLRTTVRWLLLGNTFSVQVIAYLLSPLLQRSVRDLGEPVQSSCSTLEKNCSVMEVGDVWALYNEQERPNWYAIIVKRTGDRFSTQQQAPSAKVAKKPPLQIEMKYLELAPAYSLDEKDRWNPLRGTGLYAARKEVDKEESWTAFSHRVTSFIRTNNEVFVFPGKHELWTVYCRRIWSPFFVYVMESTINISALSSIAPNAEGFSARCSVVIKTGEQETYRRTEKVLELKDLTVFCFQVPYTFKQQADLLKVEIGTGGRRYKKFERDIRKMWKRKRKEEDELLSQEWEILADVAAEEEVTASPPPEEQECVLEVDLGCQCRYRQALIEESEWNFENSARRVIIIDDDDDE